MAQWIAQRIPPELFCVVFTFAASHGIFIMLQRDILAKLIAEDYKLLAKFIKYFYDKIKPTRRYFFRSPTANSITPSE